MSLSDDIDDLAMGCEDVTPRKVRSARGMAATGFMRLDDVKAATGLSRTSIYRMIAVGEFPRQVSLGRRNSQWLRSEVEAWIQSCIDARGDA